MLTIISFFKRHLTIYPIFKGLGYLWAFGSLLSFFLLLQTLTGIFLSCYYIPTTTNALKSINFIIFDIKGGWFIQRLHVWGAHTIFLVLYLHFFRSLYYKFFIWELRLGWWSGYILFLLLMATAFLGYILPWGQMSFWAATVIINMFTVVPYIGDWLTTFLWGSVTVTSYTLQRFFVLHILLPFIIIGIIPLHISLVHVVESSLDSFPTHYSRNLTIKTSDTFNINLYPHYILKDFTVFICFLTVIIIMIIISPELLNNPVNWTPANITQTPTHIIPEWYFLPFYGIVKALPSKVWGIFLMFIFIISPLILPRIVTIIK